jgi:hypothetical protein
MRDLATLYTTVATYVYNPEEMDWEAAKPNASGGGGGVASSVEVTNFPSSIIVSALPALAAGSNTIGKVDINGTVPVSGTFWQATQPVSIASMPTTPVTGTFWQATQPVSLSTLPALAAGANNIGTVNINGTVPVSGSFWQTTQPVSIAASVGVTGTFWQAIQPVSIASMPTTPVTGSFWQPTQPVSIATLPTLTAGTNNIGDVDVLTVPTDPFGANADVASATGSISAKLRFIAGTGIPITGTVTVGTHAVTQSGTWNIGTVTTLPSISLAASANNIGNVTVANASLAVTGTFWQATQPVSIASMPSTPVTGTFWQATQPVSLSSTTITGTVAATQSGTWNIGSITTLPALVAGTALIGKVGIDQTTPGTTNKVSIGTDGTVAANIVGTVPVSGTFWQATQPVSIAASVGVTGTFWQATQPVSIATAPVLVAGTAVIGKVGIDQTTPGTTNKVSIGTDGTVTINAIPAGSNNIGDVDVASITFPTLTKGSQGATGITTQNLKDAGRTELTFYAVAAAAGATTVETAITLTKSAGTAATSTGTSFVVTNGKRFRISSIVFASRGHAAATAQLTTFSLRINTGGAVTTSSTPIILRATTATPAVSSEWDRYTAVLPDGYEIVGDGTLQFGITANATFTTNAPTWFVTIHGFEY